jgi:DNA-binding transcriptional MerR regulator
MLSIGTFAGLGGVSVRTLRYYDEVGLLHPTTVDATTGYRSYSARQLPRLHRIVALKELGLSLEQLRPLLDDVGLDQLRRMLVLKRAELQEELISNQARLNEVELRLRYIESEDEMPADVIVKSIPPLHIAAIRVDRPGLDFNNMGPQVRPAFGALAQRLRAAGVRHNGPMFMFYKENSDDSLVPHVAVDVGDQAVPTDDEVIDTTLPAVNVACSVYHGPFNHSQVGPIYGELARWAEDHGYAVQGPGRDIAIEPPAASGGDGVLELQLPIERA